MSIRSEINELKKDLKEQENEKLINKILDKYWFSWFCERSQIIPKTKTMLSLLEFIVDSVLLDNEDLTFEITNNYPLYGKPYEDIRIVSGEVTIYLIVPYQGINEKKGVAELWSVENDFEFPIYCGSLSGLIDFFNK